MYGDGRRPSFRLTRRSALTVVTGSVLATFATHPAARGQSDELVTPASDARNLAAGGGWMVWSAHNGHAWRLVIRTRAGSVAWAPVRPFGAAPRASVGARATFPARWVAVYARCAGHSATRACDLYEYDLAARRERKLSRLSTSEGSERAPSLQHGTYVFARAGGPRPGTYTATSRHLARIDRRVATSTAIDGVGHVAYISAGSIYAARVSGRDRTTLAHVESAFSLFLTPGVRAGWLQRDSARGDVVAHRTARLFRGYDSGALQTGLRSLPASTNSAIPGGSSQIAYYLDARGVYRPIAPVFTR